MREVESQSPQIELPFRDKGGEKMEGLQGVEEKERCLPIPERGREPGDPKTGDLISSLPPGIRKATGEEVSFAVIRYLSDGQRLWLYHALLQKRFDPKVGDISKDWLFARFYEIKDKLAGRGGSQYPSSLNKKKETAKRVARLIRGKDRGSAPPKEIARATPAEARRKVPKVVREPRVTPAQARRKTPRGGFDSGIGPA